MSWSVRMTGIGCQCGACVNRRSESGLKYSHSRGASLVGGGCQVVNNVHGRL